MNIEAIDYLNKKRLKSLVFKVDFEKAFDSLNWDFLLEMMKRMGFGERWRRWLLACLKSSSISILVNGSPTNEFPIERGVRQGDPLSPFLFIIAAEGLNLLTKNAIDGALFKGVEIGYDIEKLGVNFSNSFFKQIGNGIDTTFWEETWLGDKPLKNVFGRLFRLEADQQAAVSDRITWARGSWHANWSWVRMPSVRACDELQELSSLLNSYPKQGLTKDSWNWKLAANGIFATRKLSGLIDDMLLRDNRTRHETLRNFLVPLKVEIFIWRVLNGRIPVRIELDKRGIDLDSVRCPLCDDNVESTDHSMFFCRLSMDIWDMVYKWWNLGAVSNLSINEAFRGKCIRSLSVMGSFIWQAVE
ncbi:uncharacterized protein [Rutidosis leptorrhynchoides]|uniref:uncharacterized protein n=1 Tax=Rutidosis leptorrhynchoides TaxID=125765 RepID=UPI003A98F03D